jgi:isopenicillin N synthase-like dioxygenase
MPTALPVLDLTELTGPALIRACRQEGFFYLAGPGLPDGLVTELSAVARDFFALPEQDKRAIEMTHSPHFRGWTRLGGELTLGHQDWREQIDIGAQRPARPAPDDEPWWILEGPNLWPAALPQLRDVVDRWQRELERIARVLVTRFALGLGQPADAFDEAFARPSTLLKIIRYPGRAAHEDPVRQGVGAHNDSGFLTLLYAQPGSRGLQVRRDDHWVDVPPIPDTLIVNIGELLEVATDGLLRATMHRVISPLPGTTRISVPYFFNPALGARLSRLPLPPDLAALAPGITRDEANVLHDRYGLNALKSRLRAHPDVATRHHPHLVGVPTPVGGQR